MRYFENLVEKKWYLLLFFSVLIATLLHITKLELPCLNADEAAFAYNAYSIAETGRDEYGAFMPLRFKSFGENKLPVTIYTIAPFVKVLALNEISSRLPFILLGIIIPILMYFLAQELFENRYISATTSLLASFSPWIQIMSRHIHENIIILAFTIIMFIYLIKLLNKFSFKYILLLSILSGISLFTYHIGKVMSFYFIFSALTITFLKSKKSWRQLLLVAFLFAVPVILYGITEIFQPNNRVSNLLFYKNDGFRLSIEENLREYPIRVIHNKVTSAVITLTDKYITYFSPEFLVNKGDANPRFGYPGISPITPIEYIFIGIGIYFLFKNKHKYRFILMSFLLIAPLSASLAWPEYSLTRSFTMIIPILLLVSFGFINLIMNTKSRNVQLFLGTTVSLGVIFFVFFTWTFYFEHYFRRPIPAASWQCGYKDLNKYLIENYDRFDNFYITKKYGQPYIFTLFFQKYPPSKYQMVAKLGALDEYGFGQVESYDKYHFTFQTPFKHKSSYIGYLDDFEGTGIPESKLKIIKYDEESIFYIYENK